MRTVRIAVDTTGPGTPISPDLFGIFFEDINYAADGGLYAELIQNRSFEFPEALAAWEVIAGAVGVGTTDPVHQNNPHYVVLEGAGLANGGFDGIPVTAGERYEVSLFARHGTSLTVRLESTSGSALGTAVIDALTPRWARHTATIVATASAADARFVVQAEGTVHLDVVSLFPQRTFLGRANGLRADLAQTIAALEPRFMRFPGGCLVHGDGLGNMYRWKDTVGPIEQRREQPNIWGYHQSAGLGYFEYFQFCEDIGAKPVPVVPAAVCCQNTLPGGQEGIPLHDMPDYIQDILDLVEWANGPATSTWGAVRAAAGHPEPFGLEYLGVGNEDTQTDVFRERFALIHQALAQRHPEITVIGTVGADESGADFEAGWDFARKLGVAMVDEHYYRSPRWMLDNVGRYDDYDRTGPKVYVGEYASKGTTTHNALAEAAFMIGFERNGDVVAMASYAPLLAKRGRTQWATDLIYFDNISVEPTPSYHVQQLFAANAGDALLPTTVDGAPKRTVPDADVAASSQKYTVRARKVADDEQPLLVRFGVSRSDNFYQWNLGGWRNRSFTLQRSVDGIVEDVGDPVLGSIETGRWYDVRIEANAARIRCFLDGVLIHEVTDTAVDTGGFEVSSVRDRATGDIIVKVANVTDQPVSATIAGLPHGQATVTALGGRPTTSKPTAQYDFPAKSFTVIRVSA